MQKKRRISGFTMAEMLIVVAIIAVLGGVTAIAVQSYWRSSAQLERDAIAKEIFVAAQNHLTMAESQGYLPNHGDETVAIAYFGTQEAAETSETNRTYTNVYSFSVHGGADYTGESLLDLMLPFSAIDESVRSGGSYIIRYQANPAVVLDVFYCPVSGGRYLHDLGDNAYADVREYSGANTNRKHCLDDDCVLGWYGGAAALDNGAYIQTPTLEVVNAERLTVEITDPNRAPRGAAVPLKLIITGEKSGAKAAFDLLETSDRFTFDVEKDKYVVILDDITTAVTDAQPDGLHFAELNGYALDSSQKAIVFEGSATFWPGENITIQAVAYSKDKLTNIAYSAESTTNSLFGDNSGLILNADGTTTATTDTAMIANFRHLENLDAVISRLDASAGIAKASQVDDLVWNDPADESSFIKAGETVSIYPCGGAAGTSNDCYYPVTPSTVTDGESYASPTALPIAYEGNYHSITGVKVDGTGDAGLFGAVTVKVAAAEDDEEEEEDEDAPVTLKPGIANLKLIDFDIKTASGNAGALAGTLTTASDAAKGTAITNVVAYNTDSATTADITAVSGMAGGLIGSMTGSTVEGCAAALTVSGTTHAGGLVGKAEDGAITASYAGGHTVGGRYAGITAGDDAGTGFNVTATGIAGGLVGESTAIVSNSYSTCSVAATGATGVAGGLVGSAGGGSFTGCYATGLVYGAATEDADGNVTTATTGAFAGSLGTGATAKDCHYYEIINEQLDNTEYPYLTALGKNGTNDNITPFDLDAATYDAFVGAPTAWNAAEPYDVTVTTPTPRTGLDTYYQVGGESKYPLMGADQLGADTKAAAPADTLETRFVATHYGDWPAPETFVINTQTTTTAP